MGMMKHFFYCLTLGIVLLSSCSLQREIPEETGHRTPLSPMVARRNEVKILVIQDGKKRGQGSNATCYDVRPLLGCWRFLPSQNSEIFQYSSWANIQLEDNYLHLAIPSSNDYVSNNSLYYDLLGESIFPIETSQIIMDSIVLHNEENNILAYLIPTGNYTFEDSHLEQHDVDIELIPIPYDYLYSSYCEALDHLNSYSGLRNIDSLYTYWNSYLTSILRDMGDDDIQPISLDIFNDFNHTIAYSGVSNIASRFPLYGCCNPILHVILRDSVNVTAWNLQDIIYQTTLSESYYNASYAKGLYEFLENIFIHWQGNCDDYILDDLVSTTIMGAMLSDRIQNGIVYGGIVAAFATYLFINNQYIE